VARSEATDIPGNAKIDAAAAALRARAIFFPYHTRIAAELDRRAAEGRPTIPDLRAQLHAGLPRRSRGLADRHAVWTRRARCASSARIIHAEGRWNVGDNEPYAVTATTDYAIPVHCERAALRHVGLEIRQDLIANAEGQDEWATRIAAWLRRLHRMSQRDPREI
jgi:predicted N-formylglutamate amidohydrolase